MSRTSAKVGLRPTDPRFVRLLVDAKPPTVQRVRHTGGRAVLARLTAPGLSDVVGRHGTMDGPARFSVRDDRRPPAP